MCPRPGYLFEIARVGTRRRAPRSGSGLALGPAAGRRAAVHARAVEGSPWLTAGEQFESTRAAGGTVVFAVNAGAGGRYGGTLCLLTSEPSAAGSLI